MGALKISFLAGKFRYRFFQLCSVALCLSLAYHLITQLSKNSSLATAHSRLIIPQISLDTPVETIYRQNRSLATPDLIAGAYYANPNKIFLIGHSRTVFTNLHHLTLDSTLEFDGQTYRIQDITTLPKSAIRMSSLLAKSAHPTIIMMTCAGTQTSNQDFTHRLIITATATP